MMWFIAGKSSPQLLVVMTSGNDGCVLVNEFTRAQWVRVWCPQQWGGKRLKKCQSNVGG
jgi:hypothetical protein